MILSFFYYPCNVPLLTDKSICRMMRRRWGRPGARRGANRGGWCSAMMTMNDDAACAQEHVLECWQCVGPVVNVDVAMYACWRRQLAAC